MNPPSLPAKEQRPSRRRRWLRLGWCALLILFLLGIIAHRPLLQCAIKWTGQYYASTKGYKLELKISGSILTDVSIDDMHLVGPPEASLQHLKWRKASIDYSLWMMLTEGLPKGLHGIALEDATIEADIRKSIKPPSHEPNAGLPDIGLQRLDLHNIHARIITDDGDILLQDLTVLLDEKKTGSLKIKELIRPATALHLKDVHGTTQLKDRTVLITDLALMPDVTVPRFSVDLQHLQKGSLPFEVTAHSGNALIISSGHIDHITHKPSVDLTLDLQHLAHSDITRWVKLPENMSWLVESAVVQIKGPLTEPRQLDATVAFTASDIHAANMHFDKLHSRASLSNGTLKLETLSLHSGPNTLQAKGNAILSPRWNDLTQLSADVQWQLNAPRLESMVENGSDLIGEFHGDGSVSIHQGRLSAMQTSLHGTQLKFYETGFTSLNMEIKSDAGMIYVTTLGIQQNDQNSVVLTGEVNLADRQHAVFRWTADIDDLTSIAMATGMKKEPPSARGFTAEGTINLDIADVLQGRLNKITSKGIAELDNLTWRKRQIERASLEFQFHDGQLDVSRLDLHLDAESRISVAGNMSLSDRRAINLHWESEINHLAPLFQWVGLMDAPETGKLSAQGKATFALTDILEHKYAHAQMEGTAVLESLEWRQRHLDAASLTFALNNGRLEVKALDVRLDPANTAHMTGDFGLSDEHQPVNISWQMELLNLAGVVPWLGVKDTPLPSAGQFNSKGKITGSWAALRARDYQSIKTKGMAHMKEVVWGNARLDFAELNFTSSDGRMNLEKLQFQLNDRNKLTASGHVMLDKAVTFDVETNGTLEQLADFSGWMELAKLPRITGGQGSLFWKGSGKISPYQIEGAGSVNITGLKLEGRTDVFALALETRHTDEHTEITKFQASSGKFRAEASMAIKDATLTIPQLVVISDKMRLIEGSAEVPLIFSKTQHPVMSLDANKPLKVHLHMARMNIQNIYTAMGRNPTVTGSVAMDIDLDGTLQEFGGRLSATLSDARIAASKNKLEPAFVQMDVAMVQRQLTIKASARQKPLETLTADAKLPFDVQKVMSSPGSFFNTPITARISLPKSDLSVLQHFIPALASIDGAVSADVQLRGPLRKPEWQGSIQADASRITIKDSDMDIRNVKARASFTGQHITLDDVSTTISGGLVKIGGTVDLTQLTDPALNLHLDANQALIVRNDTMSLRADGRLTCIGTLAKADVTGRMELVRGRIFKEIEFLPLSLPDQLPPPPPVVRATSKTPSAPAPFALWGLNIDIVTRDPVRLLGNVLNGSAVADLHISGTGAVPILEGTISQQAARIRLPFSHLALTRGDITFTRDKPFDPQLDLQGDSIVGNYHVTVYASGSAVKPALRFTSSPPLSEPDIATLLATGAAKGDAQTAEGVAANRVAFLVLSKAYRKLFSKAAPIRKNEEPGRFTVNLNPLSTESSLGTLSATYEISPHWQAEVGLGDRGFRGLVHYLIRFR